MKKCKIGKGVLLGHLTCPPHPKVHIYHITCSSPINNVCSWRRGNFLNVYDGDSDIEICPCRMSDCHTDKPKDGQTVEHDRNTHRADD